MWFEGLTGFREVDGADVRRRLRVDGEDLVTDDGRRLRFGRFQTPSLADLRERAASIGWSGPTSVREVVGDVGALHRGLNNEGSTFQVASQFNTLEMVGPGVTPDDGIDGYENDHTQGPACAIACGAGTVYRNYFASVGDQVGQTADRQIDCSADLADAFGVDLGFRNGYLLPTAEALASVSAQIEGADEGERNALMGLLRVGFQLDTGVTGGASSTGEPLAVNQVYCSAVPVAYADLSAEEWEPLARLVLDATYEATFASAVENAARTGNASLFLTLVGGGAFGNDQRWIMSAVERALDLYSDAGLDVRIVSYGRSDPTIEQWAATWSRSTQR